MTATFKGNKERYLLCRLIHVQENTIGIIKILFACTHNLKNKTSHNKCPGIRKIPSQRGKAKVKTYLVKSITENSLLIKWNIT